MIDTTTFPQDDYTYTYLAGPVESREELDGEIKEGNCRFALQQYFYRMHGLFLEKDEIYLPGGYKVLGEFIFKEEPIDFSELKRGDILYAQKLRGKEGGMLNKGIENFKDKDEWLYYLHSAIYLGTIDSDSDIPYVWHATYIENGPVVWPMDKFEYYFKIVSAKRVL